MPETHEETSHSHQFSTAFVGNNSGIGLAGSEQIANGAILTRTPTAYGGGARQDSFFRLNGHTTTYGTGTLVDRDDAVRCFTGGRRPRPFVQRHEMAGTDDPEGSDGRGRFHSPSGRW